MDLQSRRPSGHLISWSNVNERDGDGKLQNYCCSDSIIWFSLPPSTFLLLMHKRTAAVNQPDTGVYKSTAASTATEIWVRIYAVEVCTPSPFLWQLTTARGRYTDTETNTLTALLHWVDTHPVISLGSNDFFVGLFWEQLWQQSGNSIMRS